MYILSESFIDCDKEIEPFSLLYLASESSIPFLYTLTEFSSAFVPISMLETGL